MYSSGNNIAGIFAELYELLDSYNIDSVESYFSISNRDRRTLSASITMFFKYNLGTIVNIANRSQGIVFNFDKFNPKWNQADRVAKKSVFYSDVSIVLLEGEVVLTKQSVEHLRGQEVYHFHNSRHANLSGSNIAPMISTLLSIRPLVLKEIVIPIPSQIRFDPNAWYKAGADLDLDQYNALIRKIRNCDFESTVVPVALDKWQVKSQFYEMEPFENGRARVQPVKIYLPYLSNLSLDMLIGLRQDHYDSFYKFQYELKEFMQMSSRVSSETAFIDIARKVDHEIRKMDSFVSDLSAQRRRKGYEAIFGIGTSAISFFVAPDIAKYLAAIFGSKSVIDSFTFLNNKSKDTSSIKNHSYYLAYVTKKHQE